MTHAGIQERLNQIAIWVMDATAEDFEALARIHTGLQEAAAAADPWPLVQQAIGQATAALEPIILRDCAFGEGIADVRAALREATDHIGDAVAPQRPAPAPEARPPAPEAAVEPDGAAAPEETPAPVAEGGRYLTFSLGETEYGIPVLAAREILRLTPITAVPRVAPAVRGVINLRGAIIPVIDLRTLLGLPRAEDTRETSIVIIDLDDQPTGVIVDRVCEVLEIPAAAIEPPPRLGAENDLRGLLGIGMVAERARLLLDMPRLLSQEALGSAARSAA